MQRQGKARLTPQVTFGKTLRELRLKAGLSQERLGFDSGYHRTYIGQGERGLINPTLEALLSIATAMQVPGHVIMRQVEEMLGKPWTKPDKRTEPRRDA